MHNFKYLALFFPLVFSPIYAWSEDDQKDEFRVDFDTVSQILAHQTHIIERVVRECNLRVERTEIKKLPDSPTRVDSYVVTLVLFSRNDDGSLGKNREEIAGRLRIESSKRLSSSNSKVVYDRKVSWMHPKPKGVACSELVH
ncbi:MAG: hypothetical protein AB7F43_12685 [Bacteriovoracia bacterium]